MSDTTTRRTFLKAGAATATVASVGLTASAQAGGASTVEEKDYIRKKIR